MEQSFPPRDIAHTNQPIAGLMRNVAVPNRTPRLPRSHARVDRLRETLGDRPQGHRLPFATDLCVIAGRSSRPVTARASAAPDAYVRIESIRRPAIAVAIDRRVSMDVTWSTDT